jgi:hypothetical protein
VPAVILSDIGPNGNIYVERKSGAIFYTRQFRRDGSGNTFSPVSACVDCVTVVPTATPTPVPTATPTPVPTATPEPTPTPLPTFYTVSMCGVGTEYVINATDIAPGIGGVYKLYSPTTLLTMDGINCWTVTGTASYNSDGDGLFGDNFISCESCAPTPTPVPTDTPTPTPLPPTDTPTPTPTPTVYTSQWSYDTQECGLACDKYYTNSLTTYYSLTNSYAIGTYLYTNSACTPTYYVPNGYYSQGANCLLIQGGQIQSNNACPQYYYYDMTDCNTLTAKVGRSTTDLSTLGATVVVIGQYNCSSIHTDTGRYNYYEAYDYDLDTKK